VPPRQQGSLVDVAQPFALHVERAALLVVDVHACVCHHEVIGFLGGHWDAEARQLCVRRAFPVRQVDTADNHVQVRLRKG
jgi:hypothetical protein